MAQRGDDQQCPRYHVNISGNQNSSIILHFNEGSTSCRNETSESPFIVRGKEEPPNVVNYPEQAGRSNDKTNLTPENRVRVETKNDVANDDVTNNYLTNNDVTNTNDLANEEHLQYLQESRDQTAALQRSDRAEKGVSGRGPTEPAEADSYYYTSYSLGSAQTVYLQ